jgi:hypothetical protein
MEMIEVISSNIKAVGYDPETSELRVQFIGDSEYTYLDVSEEVYTQLINAESVGKYFAAHIKKEYSFRKETK